MQWHPEHHRAASVAEIPLQRRRLRDHQAERARPERTDELAGPRRHGVNQTLDGVPGSDQDAHRHVAAASFGRQQRGHRGAVEGVGADAVDRIRRHDNQFAAFERTYRRGDALCTLGGVSAVKHLRHRRRPSFGLSRTSVARSDLAGLRRRRKVLCL